MAIVPDLARPWMPVDPHIPSKLELAGSGRTVGVTPSNTVNLARPLKGIICETAGDIAVVAPDGSVNVITAVAGQTIPCVAIRINSTGTTSTGISGIV